VWHRTGEGEGEESDGQIPVLHVLSLSDFRANFRWKVSQVKSSQIIREFVLQLRLASHVFYTLPMTEI
jgi:hypothetical protein